MLLLALRAFFAGSFVGAHVKLQFPVPMSSTGKYTAANYQCLQIR